ncbi:hypothetical protein [Sporohalobacter salinus]|uniref:hypothetical protein n=1 Tax=Sporohalobacter salinus TaxID=1494606 RepID=UPI00195FEC15|nr:hypothetical protein [Sporohalobacter salinus]MBM7623708.1 hypothetical protein [Sporohalobacter salinus]
MGGFINCYSVSNAVYSITSGYNEWLEHKFEVEFEDKNTYFNKDKDVTDNGYGMGLTTEEMTLKTAYEN